MPNYRTFQASSYATSGELFVRTLARDEADPDVLLVQTTRGATIWLGPDDVEALTNFCRSELLAWQAQNNDDVVDARIMCGAVYSDGVECALPDGHAPIGRGEAKDSEALTHVTAGGLVFDDKVGA